MALVKIIAETGTLDFQNGFLVDRHVSAATQLDADKLQHLYKPATNFDLPIGGTPATREEIVFVASTAGIIRAFHCLLNADGSSTDIDFDLKVNGVSVLSAAVNITDATGDGVVQDGTISGAALVAGDIVSIAMTVTSATGATGPFAWAEIEENAA